jgi:hypothetical protein
MLDDSARPIRSVHRDLSAAANTDADLVRPDVVGASADPAVVR